MKVEIHSRKQRGPARSNHTLRSSYMETSHTLSPNPINTYVVVHLHDMLFILAFLILRDSLHSASLTWVLECFLQVHPTLWTSTTNTQSHSWPCSAAETKENSVLLLQEEHNPKTKIQSDQIPKKPKIRKFKTFYWIRLDLEFNFDF